MQNEFLYSFVIKTYKAWVHETVVGYVSFLSLVLEYPITNPIHISGNGEVNLNELTHEQCGQNFAFPAFLMVMAKTYKLRFQVRSSQTVNRYFFHFVNRSWFQDVSCGRQDSGRDGSGREDVLRCFFFEYEEISRGSLVFQRLS